MRFHSPDSLSPFAAGGVNPYTYCLGNPIALRDPTGHDASVQSGRLPRNDEGQLYPRSAGGGGGAMAWVMVGVGAFFTLIGFSATVASFGLLSPVTVPVTVMGITTTSTAAAAVTIGALGTSTALGVLSTGASVYATATGDRTASEIGNVAAYASIPFGFAGGFLSSATKSATQAALKALEEPVEQSISALRLYGATGALTKATGTIAVGTSSTAKQATGLVASDALSQAGRIARSGPRMPPISTRAATTQVGTGDNAMQGASVPASDTVPRNWRATTAVRKQLKPDIRLKQNFWRTTLFVRR